MNDGFTEDRAPFAENGRATLPVWQTRGQGSQSGKGFAEWKAARPQVDRPHRRMPERSRPRRRPHAGEQLLKLLTGYFSNSTPRLTAQRHNPWASITFTGLRHEFVFTLLELPDDAKMSQLSQHQFALTGHVLADITAQLGGETGSPVLRIEALTVETDEP